MANDIRAQAEAFCPSYAKAVNCTDPAKTEEAAKAILSHYVPKGFVAFSLGGIHPLSDKDEAAKNAKPYLDRWFTLGIDLDVRLESCRIDVVSNFNALCFLTWKAYPFSECGEKEWTFENVYSYRLLPGQEDGRGAFEFTISDNETSALMDRFLTFFNTL